MFIIYYSVLDWEIEYKVYTGKKAKEILKKLKYIERKMKKIKIYNLYM